MCWETWLGIGWVSGSICTINLWLECHFAANRTITKYLSCASSSSPTFSTSTIRIECENSGMNVTPPTNKYTRFWFIYIISQFVRLPMSALLHASNFSLCSALVDAQNALLAQRGEFMTIENKIDALFIWFYTSAKLKIFKIVSQHRNRLPSAPSIFFLSLLFSVQHFQFSCNFFNRLASLRHNQ